MKKRSYVYVVLSALIALSMVLTACSPTASPVSDQSPQQPAQSDNSTSKPAAETNTPVTISFFMHITQTWKRNIWKKL